MNFSYQLIGAHYKVAPFEETDFNEVTALEGQYDISQFTSASVEHNKQAIYVSYLLIIIQLFLVLIGIVFFIIGIRHIIYNVKLKKAKKDTEIEGNVKLKKVGVVIYFILSIVFVFAAEVLQIIKCF